jgi:hypothetical protein
MIITFNMVDKMLMGHLLLINNLLVIFNKKYLKIHNSKLS